MKLPALLPILLSPLTLALPSPPSLSTLLPRETAEQATDRLLFNSTMPQFQAARAALSPPTLDWTSDGCSDSPDNPLGFKFTPSCQRHDFGYRNYKAQNRFTDANKLRIDNNFKSDLDNYCATVGEEEEEACRGVADVYYEAVRLFGRRMAVREDGERVYLEEA